MGNIGQIIGKITHTFSTRLDNGDRVQITVTFDFSTCTDEDIKQWIVSNRVIALQRPLRKMEKHEVEKLNGSTIMAETAGKKIETRSEKRKTLLRAGVPEKFVDIIIDNPAMLDEIVVRKNNESDKSE